MKRIVFLPFLDFFPWKLHRGIRYIDYFILFFFPLLLKPLLLPKGAPPIFMTFVYLCVYFVTCWLSIRVTWISKGRKATYWNMEDLWYYSMEESKSLLPATTSCQEPRRRDGPHECLSSSSCWQPPYRSNADTHSSTRACVWWPCPSSVSQNSSSFSGAHSLSTTSSLL